MLLARILCIALLLSSAGRGEDVSKPLHLVRASGEATVTAKPDRAQISIGVVNEASTAQAASSQNAAQTAQLIESVKRGLGSRGDIKTTNYSISPAYQYVDGKPPKLTGYKAENTVLVTIDDLSLVGQIIDNSTNAGANAINGISFSLRNDEAVRSQALAEAAVAARASAEAIARALKLQVIGVLQAESAEAPAIRPRPQAFMTQRLAQASTPIEAGTLDVHASVVVTLAVR